MKIWSLEISNGLKKNPIFQLGTRSRPDYWVLGRRSKRSKIWLCHLADRLWFLCHLWNVYKKLKRYKKCCNIVKNILEVDIFGKIDSQISHDNNFLLFPIPFPLELRCGVDVNWFEWEASRSSISILDNWLRLCRCSELVHFEYLPREINSSGKLNSAAIAWPLIWN